jgi:DNA mismatch repair protein MutL
VIDRPAALVREFMDNAIDAGASSVETLIEGGGIRRVEVIDDGSGMGREDLSLCWEAHATSKIRSLADLSTARTLGFRGEALAAAASAARLEILSSADGRDAWLLEAGPGAGARLTQTRRVRGSSVRAIGLFDSIPARKRFLKREAGEGALCRQVFIEKALAFPEREFRFTQDGKLRLFFPAAASYRERFAQMLEGPEGAFLHELGAAGPGFSLAIVAGGPELYRQDRRQQYLFANGRRIQDYALLQAFEYGLAHWFPNGTHPVGAVYLDIDPALADFNVHPAKREARFRDAGALHHAISSALIRYSRDAFPGSAGTPEDAGRGAGESPAGGLFAGGGGGRAGNGSGASGSLAMEALLDRPPAFAPRPGGNAASGEGFPAEGAALAERAAAYDTEGGLRLVGRAFNLFILAERGAVLYLIDQHAAHERLLYDRFLAAPIPRQELLVAIPFETGGGEEDNFLRGRREELSRLGIELECEGGSWRITALPVNWRMEDRKTVEEILRLREAGENMAERWAATLSCHRAVKDGDYLDDTAALALAEAALALPVPRCPHGRPVWKELSREELFRAVRRVG